MNRKDKELVECLTDLQRIEREMIALGDRTRHEDSIQRAELEERQRLGLHGDAAIKHYNSWMRQYGLYDLVIKDS